MTSHYSTQVLFQLAMVTLAHTAHLSWSYWCSVGIRSAVRDCGLVLYFHFLLLVCDKSGCVEASTVILEEGFGPKLWNIGYCLWLQKNLVFVLMRCHPTPRYCPQQNAMFDKCNNQNNILHVISTLCTLYSQQMLVVRCKLVPTTPYNKIHFIR